MKTTRHCCLVCYALYDRKTRKHTWNFCSTACRAAHTRQRVFRRLVKHEVERALGSRNPRFSEGSRNLGEPAL